MKLTNNPTVHLKVERGGNTVIHTGRLLDILAEHFDEGEHVGIRSVLFQNQWCFGSEPGVEWTIEQELT